MTQDQLSAMSGISRQAIGAYEEGRAIPPLPNLFRLADALLVPRAKIINELLPSQTHGITKNPSTDAIRIGQLENQINQIKNILNDDSIGN